jgi:hypothetical protein
VTQISFFCCITCLNIASIVDTAQVVDQILSRFRGGAVAFEWRQGGWEIIRWAAHNCSGERIQNGKCIPFEADHNNDTWLLTTGYLLSALMFLPMSLKNLKENTLFQIVGLVVLMVISGQFVYSFFVHGIDFSNVSLWGTDWADMFGVVLFNFAVVIAVPAWLYERRPDVSVVSGEYPRMTYYSSQSLSYLKVSLLIMLTYLRFDPMITNDVWQPLTTLPSLALFCTCLWGVLEH